MNQSMTASPTGGAQPHPVVALRDQLTQAMAAATQLRAILATVEDPDAIRAILAALGKSRDMAGRAPPSAAAQTPSQSAAIGA